MISIKNNIGLVKHAYRAYNEHWGYVRGTYGKTLTEKILQEKIEQCGTAITKYLDYIRKHYMNKRTTDCINLVKGYIWWDDAKDEPVYQKYVNDVKVDLTEDDMYQAAKVKGKIDIMPDIQGLVVWKPGHAGVYVGNGYTIEAKGTLTGVIKQPLIGGVSNWQAWFECPYIDYSTKWKSWKEIIAEFTDHPNEWENAITVAINAAKADGDLGALEIFKYLPNLLEKIYNR